MIDWEETFRRQAEERELLRLERKFEEELAKAERDKANLWIDGQPVYTAEHHEKRLAEALAPAQSLAEQLVEKAHEMEQAAARVEAVLEGGDPTDWLEPAEMERAASLREFVMEEVKAARYSELAQRLRNVQAQGDKARVFLYTRYAAERLNDYQPAERAELVPLISEMRSSLIPATFERDKKQAEARLADARRLRSMAGRVHEVDGTNERVKEQMRLQIGAYL